MSKQPQKATSTKSNSSQSNAQNATSLGRDAKRVLKMLDHAKEIEKRRQNCGVERS